MARDLIRYFDASLDGNGLEGFLHYVNVVITDSWMMPLFLFVFYGLSIYMGTKTQYKMGAWIAYCSLAFGILGMIAQTFTSFNQMVIFVFALGIAIGIIISFVENAKT